MVFDYFPDYHHRVLVTVYGAVEVWVAFDQVQRRSFASLPHVYGMQYPDLETEELVQYGPRIKLLTSSLHCDPIVKTPYYK